MRIEEYNKLPDRVSIKELEIMIVDILKKYENGMIFKEEFLDIVNILAERQVFTYEILNDKIRKKLDDKIKLIWNTEKYDEVDVILSIVINLGLQGTYEKVKESLKNNKNIDKKILLEIQETVEDNGEDISNPYRSLEKFRWNLWFYYRSKITGITVYKRSIDMLHKYQVNLRIGLVRIYKINYWVKQKIHSWKMQ